MGRLAGGGWSSLSADLLREISGRLSSDADHLHIHQVQGATRQKTLFWRPGDATWTTLNDRETFDIETVVFHKGKAYYIDILGNITICDLNSGTDPRSSQIFYESILLPKLCRCDQHHRQRGVHLATCNGELLVVVLYRGSHPSPAEVYKPVWAPSQRLELHERVMNLGDHSLFVGRGDTFALSAKEFPAIKRNCIYYADKLCHKWYWISVFHLDSDVVENIPYPEELKDDRNNWMPHAWFCPRTPLLKQQ
ncbi:unnamed protein product [Urochloa humidicola]